MSIGNDDFTIEFWHKAGPVPEGKIMSMDDLKPPPPIAEGQWTEFKLTRKSMRTVVHTTERIDDVVYAAIIVYGEDGRMEEKRLVRGDLVRG